MPQFMRDIKAAPHRCGRVSSGDYKRNRTTPERESVYAVSRDRDVGNKDAATFDKFDQISDWSVPKTPCSSDRSCSGLDLVFFEIPAFGRRRCWNIWGGKIDLAAVKRNQKRQPFA